MLPLPSLWVLLLPGYQASIQQLYFIESNGYKSRASTAFLYMSIYVYAGLIITGLYLLFRSCYCQDTRLGYDRYTSLRAMVAGLYLFCRSCILPRYGSLCIVVASLYEVKSRGSAAEHVLFFECHRKYHNGNAPENIDLVIFCDTYLQWDFHYNIF